MEGLLFLNFEVKVEANLATFKAIDFLGLLSLLLLINHPIPLQAIKIFKSSIRKNIIKNHDLLLRRYLNQRSREPTMFMTEKENFIASHTLRRIHIERVKNDRRGSFLGIDPLKANNIKIKPKAVPPLRNLHRVRRRKVSGEGDDRGDKSEFEAHREIRQLA